MILDQIKVSREDDPWSDKDFKGTVEYLACHSTNGAFDNQSHLGFIQRLRYFKNVLPSLPRFIAT